MFKLKRADHLKQPKVFYLSVCTSTFERLGFYLLTFLLVLYTKSIFQFSDTMAFVLFGVFSGLVYVMPAIGGYLADNVFGIRRCMVWGLYLEAAGLFLLAIPFDVKFFFPFGLASVILGVGFFKTGPTDLMARSYKEKDPRIDSGFTWYYMAMNIGGILSPILAGVIQRYYGWSAAFAVAGCSLLLAMLSYFLLHHTAAHVDVKVGEHKLSPVKKLQLIIGIIAALLVSAFLVSNAKTADIFFFIATILVFAYLLFEIVKSNKEDALKILACIILIIMGLVFYIFYYQAFTSINLFIKRGVSHVIAGYDIPSLAFLSLDPIWILILSPILAFLYEYLGKHKKDLTVATKFPLGLCAISLCFLSLTIGCTFFVRPDLKVSAGWVVLAFFLFGLGELLIGALGVAMVTHIAPKRMYGVMMGAWYLVAMSVSASVSGLFASLTSVADNIKDPRLILHIYNIGFLKMAIIGLVFTIISFAVSPYLKRIAKLG